MDSDQLKKQKVMARKNMDYQELILLIKRGHVKEF